MTTAEVHAYIRKMHYKIILYQLFLLDVFMRISILPDPVLRCRIARPKDLDGRGFGTCTNILHVYGCNMVRTQSRIVKGYRYLFLYSLLLSIYVLGYLIL